MWSLIFEPQNASTTQQINTEIQRVVAQDPRLAISDINVYAQENGILVELEVQTVQGQNSEMLSIFFDQNQQRAGYSDV